MTTVAVVGAGAWGTAFACHLASRAHAAPRVMLCWRDAEAARAADRARENARYLPGVALPTVVAMHGRSHVGRARRPADPGGAGRRIA